MDFLSFFLSLNRFPSFPLPFFFSFSFLPFFIFLNLSFLPFLCFLPSCYPFFAFPLSFRLSFISIRLSSFLSSLLSFHLPCLSSFPWKLGLNQWNYKGGGGVLSDLAVYFYIFISMWPLTLSVAHMAELSWAVDVIWRKNTRIPRKSTGRFPYFDLDVT